jgi:MarR family transcriptional regulator for hemolysin
LSGKTRASAKREKAVKTDVAEDEVFGSLLPDREGYPEPVLALTINIVMAGRRWRSVIDDKLRQIGMSASRMEAMAAIAYAPRFTTQIQIAKRVGIEGPTLTRTLDMLEADGLVERLPDPSDRRNKHMQLTPQGYEALAHMMAICEPLRTRLLDGLPPAEIGSVGQFLKLLCDRIETGAVLPDHD